MQSRTFAQKFQAAIIIALFFSLILCHGNLAIVFAQIPYHGATSNGAVGGQLDPRTQGGAMPPAPTGENPGAPLPDVYRNDATGAESQPFGTPNFRTSSNDMTGQSGTGAGASNLSMSNGGLGQSSALGNMRTLSTETSVSGQNAYGGATTQNPQSMQNIADQQPTLNGARQQGTTQATQSNDVQYLKSVATESHPCYGLMVKLQRQPKDDTEKYAYLYEVLSGVPSPQQRNELVKAYWDLCNKMLKYHIRLGQYQRLEHAQRNVQTSQTLSNEIDAALKIVAKQYRALELEFIQAQYRFAALQSQYSPSTTRWRSLYADNSGNNVMSPPKPEQQMILSIPADFPLVVPYDTKMEELKKHKQLSQKSLLLDRTIPLQYETIQARKEAKQLAEKKWMDALQAGQSPVSDIEAYTQEEMALIEAIVDYNNQIIDYVTETFGGNIPEKQLLGCILVLPQQPTGETAQNANSAQTPRETYGTTIP